MSRRMQSAEKTPASKSFATARPDLARNDAKRFSSNRESAGRAATPAIPPIVREVINSQGKPLDSKTSEFMQSRLGYEFSRLNIHSTGSSLQRSAANSARLDDRSETQAQSLADRVTTATPSDPAQTQEGPAGFDFRNVRIHSDEKAAKSAQAIDAVAYTVGRNVVFSANQYSPNSIAGQRLLAHELTHVIQQGGTDAPGKFLQRQPAAGVASEEKPVPVDQSPALQPAVAANQPGAQTPAAQTPQLNPPVPAGQQKTENAADGQKKTLKLSESDEQRLQEMVANAIVPLMPNEVELNGNREQDTANLAEYFLCSSANDFRNPLDPDPLFCLVSEVTRSKPVFSDFKREAIEPVYDKLPAPQKSFLLVRHWPRHLPMAERKGGPHISVAKDKAELVVPKLKETAQITPEQQAMVDQIKANRDAIKDPTEEMKLSSYGGNKKAGYMYRGKSAPATPKGTEAKGDARRTQVNEVIWKELSGEGGISAINTYDEQILTWGKGFGASTGGLRKVMEFLPLRMRYKLLEAGVAYMDGKWLVVNTQTGLVEQENDALRLIQFDKKLLSLLISLAEDNSQEFAEAQWKAMAVTAGKFPSSVLNWSDDAIALAAHSIHWRSTGWSPYEGTGGDVKKIVEVIGKKVGKIDSKRGGATFLGPVSSQILLSFAKGIAKTVLIGAAPLPADIAKGNYSGHIFFEVAGSDKFWHLIP